jgi:dTDP-4-amino-4,6-dideoxygalactose transaminase
MIPLLDLKRQYHDLRDEVDAAIRGVLESSAFILGPEVAAFETEFSAYSRVPHTVALNSGASALHLALLAAGVGSGDEVITVPFTFVATVAAIAYTGARPVLVDIEPRFYTMDVSKIEAAITPRTKAILPVHLYGQPADMDPLMELAGRRGLAVIEDAAQAHGAEYHGRRVGGIGDLGCFSFYPGKNLGAFGEGGAVTTANPEFDRVLRVWRDCGQDRKYHHVLKGYNYRMDGLQGAILRVKLRRLEQWTEARRRHAAFLDAALDGLPLETPAVRPGSRHVYHQYVIRVARRDEIAESLGRRGIQTGVHYPVPVHLQPGYQDLGYRAGDFPVAEQAAREVLSLPVYPELDAAALQQIADGVRQAVLNAP